MLLLSYEYPLTKTSIFVNFFVINCNFTKANAIKSHDITYCIPIYNVYIS